MKGVIGGVIVLAGIGFLILMLSPMMGGLHDFRSDNTTASYSVALNASQTSVNVTLPRALFNSDVQYASVTSNNSLDVPLAASYVAATRALHVTGLIASQNRTLTVAYDIGVLNANVDAVANTGPTLWMFGVVALILLAIAGAVVAVTRR